MIINTNLSIIYKLNNNFIPKIFSIKIISQIHQYISTVANMSSKKYSFVDDYEITSFIGKGSTSRVYQGYNILTK
jgi:hypothetical protein